MSNKTYRIGEVAQMLNLKAYVLRFWESEFPQIAPLRTEKGQRLYREEDVELLKRIQSLVHDQGMTIEGARRIIDGSSEIGENPNDVKDQEFINSIVNELTAIKELLTMPDNE